MNEAIDKNLFRRLYIKYIMQDKQGIKSNRQQIMKDYYSSTGLKLSNWQYKELVLSLDKEECYRESRGELPTRKVEDYGVIEKEGLYYSDKYIEIDVHSKLSPEDVLKAHGFDPTKWEIVNAGSTGSRIGTAKNDEQYFINTYRKVTVKPKAYVFSEDKLEYMLKNIKPITIESNYQPSTNKINLISLFDKHFPLNTCADYKTTQDKIIRNIRLEHRDVTFIVIGQDEAHNDNFRGQTSSGTPIEKIDLNKAYEESLAFNRPIIEEALKYSNEVVLVYSVGNHDETVGNAIARILHATYPQTQLDIKGETKYVHVHEQDEMAEYKLISYYNNCIGLTHGTFVGRKKKRLHDIYMELFPDEFTIKKQRYILTGHYHEDKLVDENGTSIYSLSTRAKTDGWHLRNGFVGNKKRFKTFEFDEVEMIGEYTV